MDKLMSRKLGVTAFILLATTVLAVLKVMTPEVVAYSPALAWLTTQDRATWTVRASNVRP